MNQSVGAKTKSSLYWNVSTKIPYEIFRFGISIVVARLLDPKDFGIVSIATMAIYYSNTLTNFGFNLALIQRKEITSDHINSVFTIDLIISSSLAIVFLLLAPQIALFFNSPESRDVIWALSIIFILTTIHDIPYTLLRRNVEFKFISIFEMSKEVSMSMITLALALLGYKYWAIVWGQLISTSIATLYIIYYAKWCPKLAYNHSALKELFNFGLWSFIRSQVSFLSNRIDRIIIGKVFNAAELGVYDKAKSLYQLPIDGIALNINSILFSSFSRVQHDKNEMKRFFLKSFVILATINFPIYFGLQALSEHFVIALLGGKWAGIIVPLKILCISGLFMTFNGLMGAFASSAGIYQRYTIRMIAATIFLTTGCLLYAENGIAGIATVFTCFSFLLFSLGFDIVRTPANISWKDFFKCVYPALCGSSIMFAIITILKMTLFQDLTVTNLLMLVVSGSFVYVTIMMLLPSASLKDIRTSIYRDCKKIFDKLY